MRLCLFHGGDLFELKTKNKYENAEDFVGREFNGSNLKVVGIVGYQGTAALFKVTCKICSQDPELFPDGYFISTKSNLENGQIPCGCSKRYRWKDWQYIISARRIGEKKYFVIHGFAEEFHGKDTKLDCECLIDGKRWTPRVGKIITSDRGCPECGKLKIGNALRLDENLALDMCKTLCNDAGYSFIRFPDNYKNASSKFEYECPIHGIQSVSYYSFTRGSRCPSCAKTGYDVNKQGSFYIVVWTKNDHSFIKFGITNQKIKTRINCQNSKTEYTYKIFYSKTWENGSIPFKLEKHIKSSLVFDVGVVRKEDFEDGYTETCNISDLETIMKTVDSWISYNEMEEN